ncbi:MAG: DUF72 domain-containing protein [Chloroflexota bacterium]|nr:DUF72 domain-containing protein [Chloroflexota bacterium]
MEEVQGKRVPRAMVGCAGWNIPRSYAARFRGEDSQLERYARVFSAVEINSSFYRPHKPETYERWAASVPEGFRFAVKVPRVITHSRKLKDAGVEMRAFLSECRYLGAKLGPLLVQLPPSLAFNSEVAEPFFSLLRGEFDGQVACEPRHASWFAPTAGDLLLSYRVARVAADPAILPAAAEPGGWGGLVYYRLHGSPRIYYSAYLPPYLEGLAGSLAQAAELGADTWCIFDNTAEGAATGNALTIMEHSQRV